jgi:hypothetical protein
MITSSPLLVGLIAAGAFAFGPLAYAQHSHGGGAHFGSGTGFSRSGSFSRPGGFNRGAGLNRATAFNRRSGFSGNAGLGRDGHFHHGHFHHHHGVFFYDPFYDPFYFGYGYGYGYGYPGYDPYYSQADYYEGRYANGNYSAEADVQAALANRGYYRGRIDGVIGARTRNAIRAFQRDNGLPVTGRVDGRLLNALGEG